MSLTVANRRALLLATMVLVIVASTALLILGDSRVDIPLAVADLAVVLMAVLLVSRTPARIGASIVPKSALSDYVAVLAHELTSPIVSIGASAQVLAKELSGRTAEARALAI